MFQQITLVGNVGSDPEMRYLPNGTPVTSFSLAVSRSWTDGNGEKQEKTVWFRVSAWRKLAETVSQYVQKGRQVMVVGEMEDARGYLDKEGNARASLEVTAQTVRFLGQRGDSQAESTTGNSDQLASGNMPDDSDIPF